MLKKINHIFFKAKKQLISKIFSKEDKNKNYIYSTGEVVFSFIFSSLFGFSTLRDNQKIKKITKISQSQLCQRTRIINVEKIRKYLFQFFLDIKKKNKFGKAILIIDKTNFELPEYLDFGKWYIKNYNEVEKKQYGVEYCFACIYFPESDQIILLDWEEVPKNGSESTSSKILMERLKKKFISRKVRLWLIVADRLYFQHYYFEQWSRIISEGFLTIPKKNSLLRKNGKGFLNQIDFHSDECEVDKLLDDKFYMGKFIIKQKKYEIWEIDKLYWARNNDHRKYITNEEKEGRTIRLIIARDCKTGKLLYTISNATNIISAVELFVSYKKRWNIEKFFQNTKERFGKFFISRNEKTFEIRMILKLIGISFFYLYMRFRRDKLNNNLGFKISYFIKKYLDEFLYNCRIYKNGRTVYCGFS